MSPMRPKDSPHPRVLVADDDPVFRELLVMQLTERGYQVDSCEDGEAAMEALGRQTYDLMVLDLVMPGVDGMTVLRHVREESPETQVILLTGAGGVDVAVEAMRLGAFDYVAKPYHKGDFLLTLERALQARRLARQNAALRVERVQARKPGETRLVYQSPEMAEVIGLAHRVAATSSLVLITGESGTGKELIAHLIHESSPRADGPFLVLNCGALPENLLESELFGHERGAFTGANAQKIGLYETADGGTLFLDEIGELTPALQVKLLRVLESGEFRRVGGTKTLRADVRIVAATNRDLTAMMRQKLYREDLYYRLNVFTLHLPTLAQRPQDFEPLLEYFLDRYSTTLGRNVRLISPQAKAILTAHSWPGNIRELGHTIERAILLTDGSTIQPSALGALAESEEGIERLVGSVIPLEDLERRHILATYERLARHREKTADALGISVRTLYRKLKDYEVA